MDRSMKFNRKVLEKMFGELENAESIYQPSNHWRVLNRVHISQLSEGNINNFKRSVNMKYFNWGILGIVVHQMRPILWALKRNNFSIFLNSSFKSYHQKLGKKVTEFDFVSAQLYKIFVSSLYNYVKETDRLGLLDKLPEPLEGNPFIVKYQDKLISQDLCNSVSEFYSINQGLNDGLVKSLKIDVCEVGAGYGRLAYVYLKVFPRTSFTIVDIPTALYLSQVYIKKIFPSEKIFYFRPFKAFKEIKKEFEAARIRFIMTPQLGFLPNRMFDQVINISSLHEMTREQIKYYLGEIDRLGKDKFYSKQWRQSRVKDNGYIKESEYPIPKSWKKIYQRQHPIQNMFFEALYTIC